LPALLCLALVPLGGCGGDSGPRVTIYSGRTEPLVGELLERFAQETGISVDVRYGQSADLALLIDQEGARSPADVFFSQSPGAIGFLAQRDRLAPLSERVRSLVDAEFRSPRELWVGVSGRVRVLVYNTDDVRRDQLPASVFDLTGPDYRGKVALAPANASFQDFVSAMRQEVGDDRTLDWLRGMKDNGSPTYANNAAIVEAVGRGEVPMGLVNHYYNERAKDENPSVKSANYFFPNRDLGSLLIVSAVGMIEGNDHRTEAERLVRFLLSKESQRFFADGTFEYPLISGVPPSADTPPLGSIQTASVNLDALGDELESTRALIEQAGLEAA
jgi:iron(III) transport system substrate-binding protein